ncbi:MAG: prepilin-type N-terminal cleavage/methylation domain-containing protein [Candidatus Omnitrophica bacterium]|nr:prepilin-type N-terminal cleavage/methylation domain-containing protein [Candidatus Omnitrophota bacterium]
MKNTKGFTLMELMIVVIVIGVLAAVALPSFNRVTEISRAQHGIDWLRNAYGAQRAFFVANDIYTGAFADLDVDLLYTVNNFSAKSVGVTATSCASITRDAASGFGYGLTMNCTTGLITCTAGAGGTAAADAIICGLLGHGSPF